jgi:hypothetical protein
VGERVERQPSVQARGGVAEAVGEHAVRELVDGHGEQQGRDLKEEAEEEAGGIAEELRHPLPVGTRSSSEPLSPGIGSPATQYRSSSHTPRSIRRQVSEQNGRCGLPAHSIGVAQRAQRGDRAAAFTSGFTIAS